MGEQLLNIINTNSDGIINDYIVVVHSIGKSIHAVLGFMSNYLAFVFNHFSYYKLIFVVLIVIVFFVILVYFRIKNSDKLDLLFYIINFLCIMPISIILNIYGYTVLLYLYIPFIICSSNIVKDKIKGKNIKYIIYFI